MRRVLLVVLLLVATQVCAEEARRDPKYEHQEMTWVQHMSKRGEDRDVVVGARLFGSVDILPSLTVWGRADASASQSAAKGQVSFGDLESFSSLKLYSAVGYQLPWRRGLYLLGIYGLAVPIDAGKPQLLERFPKVVALGVSQGFELGGETGFALLAFGRHDEAGQAPASPGQSGAPAVAQQDRRFDKLGVTVQVPIKAGTFVVGDMVVCVVRSERCSAFATYGIGYRF